MSEWKECKLGDLAEITSSKRIFYSEYVTTGVPFYRSKEIIEKYNKQNSKIELFIKRERYEEIKLKFGAPIEGNILLTSVGTLGIPYIVRKEDEFYFKDGNLTWFRNIDFKIIDNRFLYYWITSNIGQQKLYESSIGSTQSALTIVGLKNIEILLPPLPEQQAIAGVISCLDDKIDLLHRQNKTLEGMAQTLWRKMFVEEAKSEWKKGKLGDIANVKHGFAFIGSYITDQETDKILVTPGNFQIGGGFKENKFKYYLDIKFPPDYILSKDDLIVTMTDLSKDGDTLGYPAFVPSIEGKFFLHNQRIGKIIFRSDETLIYKPFLYYLLKSEDYRSYVLGSSSGTSIIHTAPDRICNYDFNIPEKKQIEIFYKYTINIFGKLSTNQNQIRTLTRMRDTLLPKLMSGELKVKL